MCPWIDRELSSAEIKSLSQPVERLTFRLRDALPWSQVPQKSKYRSFSLAKPVKTKRRVSIKVTKSKSM